MNKIYIVASILLMCIIYVGGDNVLGCGGFLKSHVQIDFSKVEINLFTKQGILKDKTSCAPNGYYFIPLYDKGDYILQLEPPPGWSFTPTKVALSINGETDVCSMGKDVNFVFKGFGITGKVESFGSSFGGPQGVKVDLKSDNQLRTTTTIRGGSFFFTPVYPGNYIVTVRHPTWKLIKKSISVTVTEGNTELPPNSLVIQGFDVVGSIKSGGTPMKGAVMILFKSANNKQAVRTEGCDTTPIGQITSQDYFLCYVATDEEGTFVFPSVSNGEYLIKPYYKGRNILFSPSSLNLTVHHDSVKVHESFEIIGFSVSGRVVNSVNGEPLANAMVYVNGNEISETKNDGKYVLAKMKTGQYKILIKADRMKFEEKIFKINPSILELPDLYPSSYELCGKVISETQQEIIITSVHSSQHFTLVSEKHSGNFCKFLPPGMYQVHVSKSKDGVQFFPINQMIEVTSQPIADIVFSQLKATITGKVVCIREIDCLPLKVFLRPIVNDSPIEGKDIITSFDDSNYKFEDVRPGTYEIILSSNTLCWKETKFVITVNSDKFSVTNFIQTGYNVVFLSSHSAKVSFVKNNLITSFDINKGRSSYCIEKVGTYEFKFEGCHTYEMPAISFNPEGENNEINVIAKKHRATIATKAAEDFGELHIIVDINGVKKQEGPIKFVNGYYTFDLFLSPQETAVLTPQSDALYFTPSSKSITGGNDCADLGVQFDAIKGKVFKGKVIPPLSGVLVSLEVDVTPILTVETDSEGKYRLPPLDHTKIYKLSASRESYVFIGPDSSGNFVAHKLAEIAVEVLDHVDNVPLQGALLSLSGGGGYRSNLQTNEEGKITFQSLSPSEYFLRPMMKEYSFEPSSKIIDVKEGATVSISLKGKRVAYSVFGQVVSLNGESEERMTIAAVGCGNCSHFSEEAISETTGHFRIRGLQPYCSYDVTVKGSFNEKDVIERSTPNLVKIIDIQSDINDVTIVVYRRAQNADILVRVSTSNTDYYKTLRVKVSRETPTTSILHTTKLDVNGFKLTDDYRSGILVHVPSVPLDGKLYSIQLESSLPHYNMQKSQIYFFTSNSSFQFAELDFDLKAVTTEEQIKQTSLWTLLLLFLCLFAIYNSETIAQFFRSQFSNINLEMIHLKSKPQSSEHVVDTQDIDEIVQTINATKRKVRPRKV